jgi:hypothetical protein
LAYTTGFKFFFWFFWVKFYGLKFSIYFFGLWFFFLGCELTLLENNFSKFWITIILFICYNKIISIFWCNNFI